MKSLGLMMIALGLALSALPASAQGETAFTVETHTEGGGGYFTLAGQTTRNPTLSVAPGQSITVTVKGMDDGVHNFCYGTECSEFVTAEGETQTLTFTAPASGTGQYYCQPHRGAGMVGTLSAGGASGATPTGAANGGDGDKDSPGLGVIGALLAISGAVVLLRRK